MLAEEQGMIDLALVWEPFGGPPSEELLVRFGISPAEFRIRVCRILNSRGSQVDAPLRQHARWALRSYHLAPQPRR
ncbi:hypothetical protein ACIA5E_16800 [Nocardia asteroides]|uniref:hypothetical protein n=1 Tax=Nocardia asteroides TaxID=1824 RepID=UPI0037B719B8